MVADGCIARGLLARRVHEHACLPSGGAGQSRLCQLLAVRPEGADYQWRKIPPGELSIDPEADERLVRVTAWAEAS